MKILSLCVMSALALAANTSAYAADASKAVVNQVWTDSVSPAHQDAYEAGTKAFNQCMQEHGVKYNLIAYRHETGDTYKYSYVTGPYTWADFDTMNAEIKPCMATWRAQGNPHLQSETSTFLVDQPEMSHLQAGWQKQAQSPLIHVIFFTLKGGHDAYATFTSVLKKYAAAAEKSKWPYPYRTMAVQGGDEGSPDYIIVIPDKSWAEAGTPASPSFWKMIENVYGKTDADAMRKSVDDSIRKVSNHFDSYNADLSYTPGK